MKKISLSKLAKICNVSQGTVDRALHGRSGIKKETKDYILKVAKEYGYNPEQKRNKLIGIIVFDLYNEYFSEMIVRLETALRKLGYYSLVMFSDKDKKAEIECIEAMFEAEVCGIILCPVNEGKEFSEYLKSWNIPIVTFGNRVDGIKYIDINHFNAMYELTKKVISKAFDKLVYFSPAVKYTDTNIYGQKERLNGFLKAVTESGVSFETVTDEAQLNNNYDKKTAIIASTDYYAMKLIFSDIAKNCTVIGFDNIESVAKFNIPIMTVSVNRAHITDIIVGYIVNGVCEDDCSSDYRIIGDQYV